MNCSCTLVEYKIKNYNFSGIELPKISTYTIYLLIFHWIMSEIPPTLKSSEYYHVYYYSGTSNYSILDF